MTRATYCRRVGTTRSRQAAPLSGRRGKGSPVLGSPVLGSRVLGSRVLGSFIRGFGVLTIALAGVTAAIGAGGWLLSITLDARSERQSTIGLPAPGGIAWLALPTSATAATVPYVMANWPDEEEKAETTGSIVPQAVALPASGVLGGYQNDDMFGSIGRHSYQFERRFSAVTDRFEQVVRLKDHPPMILPPRPRQQLAALPPANAIPDDDPKLAKTAIYDINARVVYMPNGEKLEAHSGYGEYMDDARHVRLRMRGVTPPNTYKLTLREALFHGEQTLRMTPENKDAMFGRTGFLVHSYLLGPNGQSNGCISVKDYPKFLAAFQRGEVERVVVVFRLPQPPAFYARRNSSKSASAL